MRVGIVDKVSKNLAMAKEQLGGAVETFEMDVTKEDEWATLKEEVMQKFGKIDLLMLNAGINVKGTWGDGDYFKKIMDVNLFGVINGLNTFVPVLQSQNQPAAVVVTGSKQGITNPPGNPAYNASKSAVKTLTEHLAYDLRESPINVHLLVPGFTFTGLSGNEPGSSKSKPDGAWWPSQVADYLFQKMDEGKFYILCPDYEVTEDMDKKRMTWGVGDMTHGRPPLTRWRPEYKAEAEKTMEKMKF